MMVHRRSRTGRPRNARSGQALILMFLIILALLGVMALTLDFGFVLLARRQMQTGVNTAALEGLRGQGIPTYDANLEELRRENARQILNLSFDDDFDLTGNNTTIGAGIDSSLIQGNGFRSTTIGPANTTLAEDLMNRSSFIFRPDNFELNQGNETHGDMVVGTYDRDPAIAHAESADYSRSDFLPTTTDPSAFLVRMRRTHGPDALDGVSGVSSRGGGLPLLLGRAGWMRAEAADADYSIRRDGVLVRATAIANAVSARAVGVADLTLSPPLVGLAPIAFELSEWQSLASTTYSLDVSNGEVSDGMLPPVATARRVAAASPAFVGEVVAAIELAWPAPDLLADGTTAEFYVPIVSGFSSATTTVSEDLITGFARISLSRAGTVYSVTPLDQVVGAENAAALAGSGWQSALRDQLESNNAAYAGLTLDEQTTVLGEVITHAFAAAAQLAAENGLLAPSLTRTLR